MNFVLDQPSGSVSVSESTLHSQPMLEYTRAQVTGHAGIEDAPSDVGEDVDKEEAATWHDATVLCQAQRGGKSAAVQSVAGSVIASERSDRTGAIFGSGRRPHAFLKEAVIARRPQSDRRSNLTRYPFHGACQGRLLSLRASEAGEAILPALPTTTPVKVGF